MSISPRISRHKPVDPTTFSPYFTWKRNSAAKREPTSEEILCEDVSLTKIRR